MNQNAIGWFNSTVTFSVNTHWYSESQPYLNSAQRQQQQSFWLDNVCLVFSSSRSKFNIAYCKIRHAEMFGPPLMPQKALRDPHLLYAPAAICQSLGWGKTLCGSWYSGIRQTSWYNTWISFKNVLIHTLESKIEVWSGLKTSVETLEAALLYSAWVNVLVLELV